MNWNEAEFPAINQTFLGKRESRWWNIDPYLFWSMSLLLLLGILMVFSASMTTALYAYGDVFYFLKRHLLGIGVGFLFLTIFTFISLERLRGLNHFLLLATFV
ncbi:MAG TPA: FtsW/RodA/SpoVE family cell cycle protein, partial [Candidatus Atribacteria bacterium]|nr:FtsW/RodA/SpoVE family cell cycle protein [Candidatus Atribacteria bacterium]